jgi:hypothetical protein
MGLTKARSYGTVPIPVLATCCSSGFHGQSPLARPSKGATRVHPRIVVTGASMDRICAHIHFRRGRARLSEMQLVMSSTHFFGNSLRFVSMIHHSMISLFSFFLRFPSKVVCRQRIQRCKDRVKLAVTQGHLFHQYIF